MSLSWARQHDTNQLCLFRTPHAAKSLPTCPQLPAHQLEWVAILHNVAQQHDQGLRGHNPLLCDCPGRHGTQASAEPGCHHAPGVCCAVSSCGPGQAAAASGSCWSGPAAPGAGHKVHQAAPASPAHKETLTRAQTGAGAAERDFACMLPCTTGVCGRHTPQPHTHSRAAAPRRTPR